MAQMTSTGVSCANTKQQSRVFSLMNSRLSREFLLHLTPTATHLLLKTVWSEVHMIKNVLSWSSFALDVMARLTYRCTKHTGDLVADPLLAIKYFHLVELGLALPCTWLLSFIYWESDRVHLPHETTWTGTNGLMWHPLPPCTAQDSNQYFTIQWHQILILGIDKLTMSSGLLLSVT